MSDAKKDFELKSDQGFASRSKDIFGQIDSLAASSKSQEKLHEKKEKEEKLENSEPRHRQRDRQGHRDLRDHLNQRSNDRNRKDTEDFKGRESIFRSPNETGWPPSSRFSRKRPHFNKRPADHMKNPHKYTKYDLSDVSREQISDRSNTRAAFDFLRELKERKETSTTEEKADLKEGSSISFKKPISKKNEECSSSNVVRDGSKRVMPECVVGQKGSSSKKSSEKSAKVSKNKQKIISLSHLDEEEDVE